MKLKYLIFIVILISSCSEDRLLSREEAVEQIRTHYGYINSAIQKGNLKKIEYKELLKDQHHPEDPFHRLAFCYSNYNDDIIQKIVIITPACNTYTYEEFLYYPDSTLAFYYYSIRSGFYFTLSNGDIGIKQNELRYYFSQKKQSFFDKLFGGNINHLNRFNQVIEDTGGRRKTYYDLNKTISFKTIYKTGGNITVTFRKEAKHILKRADTYIKNFIEGNNILN